MGKLTVLPKALLFDLDGTLANTITQLAIAASKSAVAIGLNPPSVETTKGFVGNGVNMLLARVIAGRFDVELKDVDPSLLKRARDVFNVEYTKGLDKDYNLYEGVKEGLEYFKSRGIKLAVVTNKPQMFALPLLSYMGIKDYFDFILGGEVIPERKPDPTPLYYVLDKLQVSKDDAVMVGDSNNDIEAGNNANMTTVFFSYGYNRKDPKELKFDYGFASFNELTSLIKSLS
uniref:HAD-IA family hydrolase n=1 Tax=Succinivibrio sp. TaxID=2053619 RepID=UPI00402ACF58